MRPEELAAVADVLERAGPHDRVFFEMPPSYAAALDGMLRTRGVSKEIVSTAEIVVLVWSRDWTQPGI
jgi:hypothetical protein